MEGKNEQSFHSSTIEYTVLKNDPSIDKQINRFQIKEKSLHISFFLSFFPGKMKKNDVVW
jgi:hypothetical protein